MRGWRARLGVLVPSANTTLEPELYSMIPEGVSLHFSRMRIQGEPPESIDRMVRDVPRCVEELTDARVDVIAFGCTGGSLYRGVEFNKKLVEQMERIGGVPATTTSTAVVEALREIGIRKVSVATPYIDWVNQMEKKFLEVVGFEVLKIEGMGINMGMGDLPPERAYRQARKVDCPEAEGIFISCTDFRTAEIIETLEHDLKKPVVTSNQATLWMLLRMAKVRTPIGGFGQLLTRL